jgi:hypothetical protein
LPRNGFRIGLPGWWCNRRCRTSPVVLEGCGGQVWLKIDQPTTQKFPARLLSARPCCTTVPYRVRTSGTYDIRKAKSTVHLHIAFTLL